jgi:hypothetical protein
MKTSTFLVLSMLGGGGCGGAPEASDKVAAGSESLDSTGPSTILAANFPQTTGCGAATSGWGGAWGSGYMQWCSGNIATSFSASVGGTYSMTVNAGGQYGVGAWPHMQLIVDGVVQGSWDVVVWAPSTNAYNSSVSLSAGSHTLSVAFTNDAYDPSNPYPDRNLYISNVVIGPPAGSASPPPPPAEYTYRCDDLAGGPADSWKLVVSSDGSKFVMTYVHDGQAELWGYEWDFSSKANTTETYQLAYWNGYYVTLPLSALNGVGPFVPQGRSTLGTCR